MSRLNELISSLCPRGVEFKTLGEVATISRGGSLQKKDFRDNGVPCIHYGQIHTKYGIFADKTFTFISEELAARQRMSSPNDIIMAVTSENVEDVCKCVAWLGTERVAVSGHTAIIHHKQNAKFLAYYFHSSMFHLQKSKLAHGTKVIEVTPNKLNDIIIPLPPLEVQQEIVNILDKFTKLEAELEAELEARKKQYEFYRDRLLTFGSDMKTATLGEIGTFYSGLHGKSKQDFINGNEYFITYMNVYSNIELNLDFQDMVLIGENESQNTLQYGDVIFTGSSETREECGLSSVLTQETGKKLYLNSFCFGYRFNDPKIFLPAFTKYLFRSHQLRRQIIQTANGVTRFNVSKNKMANITIPLPPLEVQQKIVDVLDKFNSLCSDLTAGLPAEINARRRQYEYYRDKLLSFEGVS